MADPAVLSGGGTLRLGAPYRVAVGVAAVQLASSGNVGGILLKALCPAQQVFLGNSAAVTTATGYQLTDNESLALDVKNADQVWAIASAAAQAVVVLPYERY